MEAILWRCLPVADTLAAYLDIRDLIALGAASRRLHHLFHGRRAIGRRLFARRSFRFASVPLLASWAGSLSSTLVLHAASGRLLVHVQTPPEILADDDRWARCRRRLAAAWQTVRSAGCTSRSDAFVEGVLAGAACGDAWLVAYCLGSMTEYAIRTDDHAPLLDAADALNERAWQEEDLGRALPMVAHVTMLLLTRVCAVAAGDRAVDPYHDDESAGDTWPPLMAAARGSDALAPSWLYSCSACHVESCPERIEAQVLFRLLGGFCRHVASSPLVESTACAYARSLVHLFDRGLAVRTNAPSAHVSAQGVLLRDCVDALAQTCDPQWRTMLEWLIHLLSVLSSSFCRATMGFADRSSALGIPLSL
jgi:hypothetical protein